MMIGSITSPISLILRRINEEEGLVLCDMKLIIAKKGAPEEHKEK